MKAICRQTSIAGMGGGCEIHRMENDAHGSDDYSERPNGRSIARKIGCAVLVLIAVFSILMIAIGGHAVVTSTDL
jgi:hypothetical protein